MADFKVVVSDPKSKKSFQSEIEQSQLMGKKISDKIKGDIVGLSGYELQITGGSDRDGFPMRKDVEGIGRKKLLITAGVGFHSSKKGVRKRKSVRGNTVSAAIAQINTKIVTYGSKPVDKLMGKKDSEKPKEKQVAEKEPAKAEEKPKEAKEEQKTAETTKEGTKKESTEVKPKQ